MRFPREVSFKSCLSAVDFGSDKKIRFSRSVGGRYRLRNGSILIFNYSRNYQSLMTLNSASTMLTLFDAWLNIPDGLPPMESVQYSFGFMKEPVLSISCYFKDFKKLVRYDDERILEEDPPFITGTGYSTGIELSYRFDIKGFANSLSYTFSRTRYKFKDEEYPPEYDRPHVFVLFGSRALGKKWELNYRFVYQTGTPITMVLGYYYTHQNYFNDYFYKYEYTEYPGGNPTKENPIYSPGNFYRLPPYHRLDVGFVKSFKFFKSKMEFYVDFINVYARLNTLTVTKEGKKFFQMPL